MQNRRVAGTLATMATLILKSLAIGFVAVGGFMVILMGDDLSSIEDVLTVFIGAPIVSWPATLIIAGLAWLVFAAIAEHRHR